MLVCICYRLLVIAINYFRDTNFLVILHLLSKMLNNCSLLSSLRDTSSVSYSKVCNTKVLLLVTSLNVLDAAESLSVPLLSRPTLLSSLSLLM